MAGITTHVQATVRRWIVRRTGGIDLSKISKVPDRLVWPLTRDGFDPVPRLGALRDGAPVAKLTSFLGLDVWLVTGDAETREVLAHTTAFSNDIRPFAGKSGDSTTGDIGGLGFTDPPDHTRLRKLLTPEFTMRRLERLRPRIGAIVESQLDTLAARAQEGDGEPDLVRDFAFPVPFLVICELLGLPVEERETFRSLASARFDVTNGGIGAFGAISGSREYLLDFTRRQRLDPGDGLVGQIIREHGDEITDFDLAGLADGVFTGGLETSASMLALGTAVLLQHPDHYRRLAQEPERVNATVEELLRYLTVVQVAFPRFVLQDMEIAGRRVRAGDVVMCHLAAADRDPRAGVDDRFDPDRTVTRQHVAFGHGFHRCVGAELARMELRIAFPALARRFPGLTLASDDLDFRRRSLVYGVESLSVRLGADALSDSLP
jgi:cytochrome P450